MRNIVPVDAEFGQEMRRTGADPLHAHAAIVQSKL
jgi:hypothetical protein